jgi:hypothetical protein
MKQNESLNGIKLSNKYKETHILIVAIHIPAFQPFMCMLTQAMLHKHFKAENMSVLRSRHG